MGNTNEFNRDTIPDLLYKRAKYSSHDIAYSFPELKQNYTWSKVWNEVQIIARGFLQLGIKKGDRVALLMEGRIELILSMYAAASVGAIAIPLNTYNKKDELQTYLRDSRPVAMIIGNKGQHLHYPSILQEIISECKQNDTDSTWIPSTIFVLDDEKGLVEPFYSISELIKLAMNKNEHDFLLACNSTRPDDPIILFYTSGTMGTPKGVLRSTASFLSSDSGKGKYKPGKVTSMMVKISDRITCNFSIMNLLPLYHLGGFSTIFTSLKACNIQIVMISHFNPVNALSIIEKERCQLLVGTPYMIQKMLNSYSPNQYDLNSLIGLVFTSSAVNHLIAEKVTQRLSLIFFMVSYGSTEAGAVANGICFLERKNNLLWSILIHLLKQTNLVSGLIDQKDIEKCAYSLAGKVDKGVEIQILDKDTQEPLPLYEHGEIYIRSHRVMRYAKNNMDRPSFTKEGWHKSGDMGFLDDKRQLTITGRLNRLISRGGEKISPIEIENVLLKHMDIDEALVIGIPDELYGEQICACIVAQKGTILTAEKLQVDLSPNLSAFKIPKYFLFLNHFPLAPTGKISISEIQRMAIDLIGDQKEYA
jgi:fatty-acyl-CoA synthase